MRSKLSFTALSLGGLIVGMALGALAHAFPSAPLDVLGKVATPVGTLFTTALQGLVLPLIVALVLSAVLGANPSAIGSLGWRTIAALFVALILTALLTIPLTGIMIAAMPLSADVLENVRKAVVAPVATASTAAAGDSWASSLFPRNIVQSAANGDIVQVLLFTFAFAVAASRLPEATRQPLTSLATAFNEAMLKLVGWVMKVSPIGVFALGFTTSRGTGGGAIGVIATFAVLMTIELVLLCLLYYPIGAFGARVSVFRFGQAVLPGQIVGISTRSSLAAVPALVDAAKNTLRLPEAAAGFVVPLCAAVFRPNRPMVSTGRLLFLAYVYDVTLTPVALTVFIATIILTSFTFAGVPTVPNAAKSMAYYVAAGIPVEGVILIEGADVLIDYARTVVGVTGNLAMASLLTRPANSPAIAPAEVTPIAAA